MPSGHDLKRFISVLVITLALGILGFLSGLLHRNVPEFRNLVEAIEESAVFWDFLIYLVFLLAGTSIVRSLLFLVRFITVKIKGERFAGRVASIEMFSKRAWSPDAWIGFSFKPTALIEFSDGSGSTMQFRQFVDNRTKPGQQVTVLYNKGSGFKTLDDYILVATHIWYLVFAGFIFWMSIFTGVLW